MLPQLASFNVWGIEPKRNVGETVTAALETFDLSQSWCLALVEVWFHAQRQATDAIMLGASVDVVTHEKDHVEIATSKTTGWTRVLPITSPLPPATAVFAGFELGSGVVLYTRCEVLDATFVEYEHASQFLLDSAVRKGFIATRLRKPGAGALTLFATHLHDYANDATGAARGAQIDELGAAVAARWKNDAMAVVGDFNVDPSEKVLYGNLQALGGHSFVSLNGYPGHAPQGTLRDEPRAVDHHLINWAPASPRFETAPFGAGKSGSDHRFVVSAW